ncbi:HAD family hydrolase [Vallitalea okinawensis]|uniref:HAD family hydrolase n=1 Tax=Vallitalea okinawensis TaxID=2078660 RepID=UPI000CFA8272|nr:HAD-IB family hydrolase [Vallitalea okinawensis]
MKLAIFDFDGTLFPKDTLPFLLSQWKANNYSSVKLLRVNLPLIPLYITYKLGLKSKLTREQMKLRAFQGFHEILKGMSEKEIKHYLTSSAEAIIKELNSEIVTEVHRVHQSGYHTVLLSGSYSLLLDKIAEYLEIDTVIGTEIRFDSQGIIDLSKDLNVASGQSKVHRLQDYFKNHSIEWEGSCAYADSYSDIHLLQTVGQPIVVNPDNELRSIATQTNWRIISSVS